MLKQFQFFIFTVSLNSSIFAYCPESKLISDIYEKNLSSTVALLNEVSNYDDLLFLMDFERVDRKFCEALLKGFEDGNLHYDYTNVELHQFLEDMFAQSHFHTLSERAG